MIIQIDETLNQLTDEDGKQSMYEVIFIVKQGENFIFSFGRSFIWLCN